MMDKVLQRQMFTAPQPMSAEGTGITSGLAEMAEKVEGLEQQIDNASDYAGVMNALRGDDNRNGRRICPCRWHQYAGCEAGRGYGPYGYG